ncbi:MAG TPA: hypothetical protein VMJ90_07945 [Anaerolineales bacterium]|nr:hypothetical protein [Anaerolineales bacterium]
MSKKVQIRLEWTVEKTLKNQPEASFVFVRLHTQCVGCWMQKFCTIKDVAEIYQLDLNKLLNDLNQNSIDRPAL